MNEVGDSEMWQGLSFREYNISQWLTFVKLQIKVRTQLTVIPFEFLPHGVV